VRDLSRSPVVSVLAPLPSMCLYVSLPPITTFDAMLSDCEASIGLTNGVSQTALQAPAS